MSRRADLHQRIQQGNCKDHQSQSWYFPSLIKNALLAAGTEPGTIEQYVSDGNLISTELDGTNWGISASIPAKYFANVKENSTLTFQTDACSDSSITDSLIQLFDGDWKKLSLTGTINKGTVSGQNISLPSKTGTFVYTIRIPEEVKNGLVIQCYGIKIRKVILTE